MRGLRFSAVLENAIAATTGRMGLRLIQCGDNGNSGITPGHG